MKDGRTHLAYKAENAVDVESEIVVAAVVYRADYSDPETLPVTIDIAREQLEAAGSPHQVEEALADKGYHKAETLQTVEDVQGVRPYIAEPARKGRRRWANKPAGQQAAVYGNRRRIRGKRGRRLGRLRSERGERPFAHICETGGGRRAWLHGVVDVSKSYLARVAAHNLGFIMLVLFGVGTPRSLQRGLEAAAALLTAAGVVIRPFLRVLVSIRRPSRSRRAFVLQAVPSRWPSQTAPFSTGC
jgi:transposase